MSDGEGGLEAFLECILLTVLPRRRFSDLSRLVMDYLVIEGYKDAAESFGNRMTVRSAIQRGDIEEAIGRVNELDPEVSTTAKRARTGRRAMDDLLG
jgi:molybdopterin-guanine dinucleotide biosynthesis protein